MMESSELPEHLIQLIQSLLTSKQAARSAIVSKSWLAAFITRPNLDFDQADFLRIDDDGTHELVRYVSNTITRYDESGLKIHSFRISVQSSWNSHYTTLIQRALANGATRLSVQAHSRYFYVPYKEVLQYENLVSLTLKRALFSKLDDQEAITCSKLESLCLEKVVIKGRDLFQRIISACPLIQNLSLFCVRVYDEGRLVGSDTSFLHDLSSIFPVLKDLTLRTPVKWDEKDMLISSCSLERLEIKLYKGRSTWYRGSGRLQGIRVDLPSIRELTFESPTYIPLLSLRSNLCVDENISTAPNHLINQVRAQIKYGYSLPGE